MFYYAVVAIDGAGNRGEISNKVAVYIHEVTTTTTTTTSTTTTTTTSTTTTTASTTKIPLPPTLSTIRTSASMPKKVSETASASVVFPVIRRFDFDKKKVKRKNIIRVQTTPANVVFLPTILPKIKNIRKAMLVTPGVKILKKDIRSIKIGNTYYILNA